MNFSVSSAAVFSLDEMEETVACDYAIFHNDDIAFDLFFHHLSQNTINSRNNFFDTLKDVMEIPNLPFPSHGRIYFAIQKGSLLFKKRLSTIIQNF